MGSSTDETLDATLFPTRSLVSTHTKALRWGVARKLIRALSAYLNILQSRLRSQVHFCADKFERNIPHISARNHYLGNRRQFHWNLLH